MTQQAEGGLDGPAVQLQGEQGASMQLWDDWMDGATQWADGALKCA